jgi:hypothetical protein
MLKTSICATLLLGAVAAIPIAAEAHPALPNPGPVMTNIVPAQWERCHWLRERIRELEYRLAYASYWERQHIEHRIWELRHQFRESCRWDR